MLGRKPVTNGTVVAALLAVAVIGGCRDKATTGPSGVQGKDFAARLNVVQGNQQSGPTAGALSQQLILKVVDAGGQPVQGAAVTFQIRSGGGSITPPAGTSNTSGLVSVTWTLGTSLGANSAIAYLTNNFVLDSALFTANATAGPPQLITIISGNAQISNVSRVLPTPLVLNVKDQFGHNISGAKVTWTPAANSGTVQVAIDTTAADGTASALWTLGTSAAQQSVTASVVGLTPVIFTATAKADTGRVITVTGGTPTAGAGTVLSPLTVTVTDRFLNPVTDTITFGDSLSGGGSVNPRTVITSNAGVATSVWTLGSKLGPQLQRIKSQSGQTLNVTTTATVAFTDVVTGSFQTCAIAASNNRTYCWGDNDVGQLGKGTQQTSLEPSTAVSSSPDSLAGPFMQFRQISAGRTYFCGLTVSKLVFCWGAVAPFVTQSNVAQATTIGATQDVFLPNTFSAGEAHMCATDLGGVPACIGSGRLGQLGADTLIDSRSTWFVTKPPPSYMAFIVAGKNHSCAMSRITNTTTPYCWGFNGSGQIGSGNLASIEKRPVPILSALKFDSLSLSAGGDHACAVENAASATPGKAWCWGSNGYGELGGGAVGTSSNIPIAVTAPVALARTYSGESHTCALTATGDAYCWGRNDYGQLGNGTTPFGTGSLTPLLVSGGHTFRSLSVGELFTCGVAVAPGTPIGPSSQPGTLYCWGDNVYGQLGTGTQGNNQPQSTPQPVKFQTLP